MILANHKKRKYIGESKRPQYTKQNCVKHGKTLLTKSRLVLALYFIGWERIENSGPITKQRRANGTQVQTSYDSLFDISLNTFSNWLVGQEGDLRSIDELKKPNHLELRSVRRSTFLQLYREWPLFVVALHHWLSPNLLPTWRDYSKLPFLRICLCLSSINILVWKQLEPTSRVSTNLSSLWLASA